MESARDLYFQEGRDKVRAQDELRRELMNRAVTLLTTSITLAVVSLLALSLVVQASGTMDIATDFLVVSGFAIVSWWLVIGYCVRALSPSSWNDGSSLTSLSDALNTHSHSDLIWYVADNYRDAWHENVAYLRDKVVSVKRAGIALFCQAGGTVALAALIVTDL